MPLRRSPVHEILESHGAEWRATDDALFVGPSTGESAPEPAFYNALSDLSPLRKLGLRGANAEKWLTQRNLVVPENVFATARLPDGGWLVRMGVRDFFLESGLDGSTVRAVDAELGRGCDGVIRIEQQDATFLVAGNCARELFSQACAIDLSRVEPERVLMTRLAGVSCTILPEWEGALLRFRLWIDPSYAIYLWEILTEILSDVQKTSLQTAFEPTRWALPTMLDVPPRIR